MELVGEKVYFGWTDVTNDIEAVKTAYVLLDLFLGMGLSIETYLKQKTL